VRAEPVFCFDRVRYVDLARLRQAQFLGLNLILLYQLPHKNGQLPRTEPEALAAWTNVQDV
jgi:hypothetical protein